MNDFESSIEVSMCYEQLGVIDDMNDSDSWA